MDRNYYAEYFELERNHWWFRARLRIIMSQVKTITSGKSNLHILNIGAATGATSVMLQQFGEVKSIEYDQPCVDLVKEKLNIEIEQGNILDLQFQDESFDLVCAFDVIEHVENDKRAVEEMKRVCKPGGTIIVTVPAFGFLWSIHDEVNHHFRRYTLTSLSKLFALSGKVVFKSYFNSLLFIPIALVRIWGKVFPFSIKRKGSGSDFGLMQNSILDKLFFNAMSAEDQLLKRKIALLAGVSALLVWKKEM